MSPAGKVLHDCLLRGITLELCRDESGEEQLFMQGPQPAIADMQGVVQPVLAEVKARVNDFARAIPPKAAERH